MPGFLLHVGATVLCAHGGQAQPTAPNPRVKVGGQPIVTLPTVYTVAGCTLPPPPAANGPCVTAQWVIGRDTRAAPAVSRCFCRTARPSARRPARR